MKFVPRAAVAAALLVLMASAVSAQSSMTGSRSFRSAEEAKRNLPPIPSGCRDAAGRNTCVALYLAEDGREGLQWRAGWGPAAGTYCVDAATADFEVDCDAADAMRRYPVPTLCVRVPGQEPSCPSRRPPRRDD